MLEILINSFLFFGMLVITLMNHYQTDMRKTREALWYLFCWTLTVLMGIHIVDLLHSWLMVNMNDIIYGSVLIGSIGYSGFLFWKIFRKERLFPVLAWTVLSGYAIVMSLMAINLFHIIKSHIH